MKHLGKVLSSAPRLKVWAIAALASTVAVAGCFGPSATDRPEVELVDLREGASMRATVKREGGKVWIEGVEGWNFAQRGSSVHAAMETVMRTVGEDVAYEYLLGTSAVAFRMQVHNEWCPSSPHPWCGYQCVGGSVNALPWKVRAYEVKPDDADGVREARAAVVASIDRGVPCAYGSEEDGVIYGYQKGGEEWLCVHPFQGGKQFVETKWPWGIAVYTGRKAEMPDRRALVVASLKQAVETAHTENVEEYDCGFHAWQQWIARLRDERWVAQRSENESDLMMGNSWIYCCLVDYRGAATGYLRLVADDLDGEATDHLRKAADFYQQMVEDVLLEGDCPLDVAPRPEDLKEGQQWTQAMRTEQARRLEAALELERQAIVEIEKALAAEGIEVRAQPTAGSEQSGQGPAHRAADRIRDDMRNLFNWGSGVYDAPGITPENEKVWAGIFDLPAEQRLAAFAAQADGHGCTQATVDEAILWLNSDQKIEAMFYLVDQRDVRGIRRFLDLLHETKSPLSFIIIRCEKIYDVLSFQPDWYIRHNNQLETAKPVAQAADAGVRKDLLNINWDQAWDDPAALYASPFRAIVEAHERLSDTYGCTQKVEDGLVLWYGEDGKLEAMFVVCDDTDLDGLRRIYRAIEEKDCPLTWLFLRLSHWQVPVFDVLSLSKNHYMAHRNRIGDWH